MTLEDKELLYVLQNSSDDVINSIISNIQPVYDYFYLHTEGMPTEHDAEVTFLMWNIHR
jgi:acid phosphatase family membrane protein YuiD